MKHSDNNWPSGLIDPRSLKAIIFDLDDTLYPERDFVLSGFQAVARWSEANLGIAAEIGMSRLRDLYDSGVRGDTFNRWLEGFDLGRDTLVEQMVRVYRQHFPAILPFPEVPLLLTRLSPKCRLGILTDGYLSVQRRKLQALEIVSYFDAIIFSDEWGHQAWKPSLRPFQEILIKLDLRPEQSIYIADNPLKDFYAPRQLGMPTFWIRRPGGEYTDRQPPTPEHAPDATILNLICLYQLAETP